MPQSNFERDFSSIKDASVPLLAIETADPAETIVKTLALVPTTTPAISWDLVSGLKPKNKAGESLLKAIFGSVQAGEAVIDPIEMLQKYAPQFSDETILYLINGHRLIGGQGTSEAVMGQALWNLRDLYKQNHRTVVILCPAIVLPEELKQDFMVLDDPLPSEDELKKRILEVFSEAGIKTPTEDILTKIIEAVKGLSMFAAETAVAMSLSKKGVNLEQLWERKRKQVEQTPGLSIYRGTETFNDVRGVENIKEFLTGVFTGNAPPTVIVFMDEIEKMFAGIQGDLSGTSQEQHGEFLKWMQDMNVLGLIEIGHPGCSKSFIAKAAAGQFGAPMVELNMSALKGSLVGQTGAQTRAALKTISAIGKPLILATSNSLSILPPELKRRFKLGTWFFDLPTKEERDAVWNLYTKKFKIRQDDVTRPEDKDWTPDEIKTCCELSWRLNKTLKKSAEYVVPIIKSSPVMVDRLRESANGRYNSASLPGVYKFEAPFKTAEGAARKIRTPEVGEA